MTSSLSSTLNVPDNASAIIRQKLGLGALEPLRVAYIPGPGDVVGTFKHWRAKRHESNIPTIAYSLMFYELMERLRAESLIISTHPVGNCGGLYEGKFRFEYIAPRPSKGRWSYFWSQFRSAKTMTAMVKRYDPHIVVTSTHNPAIAWRKLANGRKLILTAHNTFWPQGRPPRSVKQYLRKAFLKSHATAIDAAICISQECVRQISELTGGRVRCEVACPQIVATFPIENREEARNLLFLGRVEESKGIYLLLDVFDRLAVRHADIKLTIVGAGGAEEEVRERLFRSAFSDRISYLGRLDAGGVHAAIAASDLLVCPTMTTFNEGLAVVGFEAAAHGIPTILSSVVPAAELLGNSCTVYEADSSESLHEALTELIENRDVYRERCSATARARDMTYDRTLSWGSGLYRTLMRS